MSADGLSYIFDGSKLTISGSGSASTDNMSSATCGQCASCSSTMARVSELFIGEDVGLSDGIFADCTSLKSVTYCGLSAPSGSEFFADGSNVVINVPSNYSDSSFGGRAVTKSSTVDEIGEASQYFFNNACRFPNTSFGVRSTGSQLRNCEGCS